LQLQLAEKKEQVTRLETAIRELEVVQREFIQHQNDIKNPELSTKTWNGQLSNAFNEIRDDISLTFKDISQLQLTDSINRIENKVNTLHYEIGSLQDNISREISRIEAEKRKRD